MIVLFEALLVEAHGNKMNKRETDNEREFMGQHCEVLDPEMWNKANVHDQAIPTPA